MALAASGQVYEHREIILREKPEAMLEASPKGTVPVFITEAGKVIDESLDLMKWALAQNDPQGWLNCDRAKANALIAANEGEFKHHLDRYKYASRYDETAKRGDTDSAHREAAEIHIQTLEQALETNEFLVGPEQSIADIAIFPFIRQFANTDKEWWAQSPYSKTRDWLTRHVESGLYKFVMIKHPLWAVQ